MLDNNYPQDADQHSDLIYLIIKCAMEVHKLLGNGFQEIIYQDALSIEFELRESPFEREFESPLFYKGEQIGTKCIDFLVDEKVMVEIKVAPQLEDIHVERATKYLDAFNMKAGLLINFGSNDLEFKNITDKKHQIR